MILLIAEIIVILLCFAVLYYLKNGAPPVPTKKFQLQRMIRLAQIKPGMKAVDLGSGDGRVVMALAQAGTEAYGFEVNPILVWWSRYKIKKVNLSDKAKILQKSFWNADLSSFGLVMVFGMSHIMPKLETKLKSELKPGSKVVSNIFRFPNWQPEYSEHGVYVYKMP